MRGFVTQRNIRNKDGVSTTSAFYTAFWETKDPATGRRRQHSKGGFRTKKEAQNHLNGVLGKVAEGRWSPDTQLTVKQLLVEHWLPAQRARGLRPATLSMYEGAANWYLIPTLGARKIGALTPADISKLVEHMRNTKSAAGREGLSARTTQVAVSTLKAATSWALKNGLIGRDPLQGVDRPRLDQKPMASWTVEQARTFLTHSADDRLATAWALFLARGPRRGEVAGLCWDAVDLDTGSLQVVKTLISVDGKALDSIPKTGAGRRTIPLDTSLVTLLRTHGVAQKAARLRAGQAWQGTGHVFTDELGRPYHPDHFSARFDKLVSETELPRIRLHDLRHTAASLMLASGVPVKVVQEMLGHSSPAITLSLYAHTTPSMAEKAGAALSERLLGSR